MSAPRCLHVDRLAAGMRLDVFLARELDLTRGYARRLLEGGRVVQGGAAPRKGTLLREGDRIEVAAFRHPREGLRPSPGIELVVVAEAHGLVAVDKPAGLPSHPLDFDETASAAQAFLARHPEARDVGRGGVEPGLVNRLDTDTSGVLLFATRGDAFRRARQAFEQQRAHKLYRARVHGRVSEARELRLRLAHAGPRMRVVRSGGRPADTDLRPLACDGRTTLLEVTLRTGARHQIRASLAHVGHPVVGDRLYGSTETLSRHLLHAHVLRLEGFEATAPPPPELEVPDDPRTGGAQGSA